MLKSLVFAAALLAAGPAFAAEPAGPAPKAANGMYVTAKGMTLYTFDKDTPGKSNCTGECAVHWPPVKAAADAKPTGDLTIITRDDGTKQWADEGKPLYTFMKDKKPGDVMGDSIPGWHAVKE